jgi:hypothetical protein
MGLGEYLIDRTDNAITRNRLKKLGYNTFQINQYIKLARIKNDILYTLRDMSERNINIKAPGKNILNNIERLRVSVLQENLEVYLNEVIDYEINFKKPAQFYVNYFKRPKRLINDLDLLIMQTLKSMDIDFRRLPNNVIGPLVRLIRAFQRLALQIERHNKEIKNNGR